MLANIKNVEKKLQELFTKEQMDNLIRTRGPGEHRLTLQNQWTDSFYVTTVLWDSAIEWVEIIANKALVEIKSTAIENIKFISNNSTTGVNFVVLTH